jgi:hypothetical protein
VNAKELVVEHPLRVNLMVRVAAHDLSLQFPCANHVIHQIVAPLGWGPRAQRDRTCESREHYNQKQAQRRFHARLLPLRVGLEIKAR